MLFKDFCPLCGYRFQGDTPKEVYNQVLEHINNGTCEENFVSWPIAAADDGRGPGKGLYKPKES